MFNLCSVALCSVHSFINYVTLGNLLTLSELFLLKFWDVSPDLPSPPVLWVDLLRQSNKIICKPFSTINI